MKVRGLSLVEVIVSLALLASVLIFVLNLFPTALATLHRVERNYDLDMRARNLLELYAAQPAADYPVGPLQMLKPLLVDELEVQPALQIWKYQDSDPSVLVKIRVTLHWKENGQVKSLTRESLVQRLER